VSFFKSCGGSVNINVEDVCARSCFGYLLSHRLFDSDDFEDLVHHSGELGCGVELDNYGFTIWLLFFGFLMRQYLLFNF
jgi:hypothetical protein